VVDSTVLGEQCTRLLEFLLATFILPIQLHILNAMYGVHHRIRHGQSYVIDRQLQFRGVSRILELHEDTITMRRIDLIPMRRQTGSTSNHQRRAV
jgi:hypothetical protein